MRHHACLQTLRSGKHLWVSVLIVLSCSIAFSLEEKPCVAFVSQRDGFRLSMSGRPVPLCASSNDYPGVLRILGKFQGDIKAVTGTSPAISIDQLPMARELVIVGTIGRSALIDSLVAGNKLDVSGVAGCHEVSLIQEVRDPFPGVSRALVIAGSDKRGTMYGMFGLSEQIGVSPWYWWADVPVTHHADIIVRAGRHTSGPASVAYRGIFLNDEFPDLTKWVEAKYGKVHARPGIPMAGDPANYGHEFYERLFELLLRLKGNYLWPAMWNNAFNEDDPENSRLADEYGIVMGTSHQEPMLRAQKEWDRRYHQTLGYWNYGRHADTLQRFWREGIRRNKDYESIITIGLRGADDTPMAPGGPQENMALLQHIVEVQRSIISEEMGIAARATPQTWCLYKEVLDFYNAGMRVPDDVVLLWPDDNWGNIRRVPTADERLRKGGAGVYYHFDYHGGPRSYQWINANPIEKVWEQMSLAKKYGADRIWIVNVGHLKGYEFPLECFMDLAWSTRALTNDNLRDYTEHWASREFGPKHAKEIADIITRYVKYNGRRKPELLSPTTYSLVNYREAEKVVADFREITQRAEKISSDLPAEYRDAFYELVLFPAKASALVNSLYYAAGLNALYAKQGRASANDMAAQTRLLFSADTALMGEFNRRLADGKWEHFMDQPHLGYTNWQDPPENSLRAIPLTEVNPGPEAVMGVVVEGSEEGWPRPDGVPVLPPFDPFSNCDGYVEVFNKGKAAFHFTATADRPWITLSSRSGTVDKQVRLVVGINWKRLAKSAEGSITIKGAGDEVRVRVLASVPVGVTRSTLCGFMESDGCVSMEAGHYWMNKGADSNRWIEIPGYGHTLSAMKAESEIDARPAVPGRDAACLEYRMYMVDTGRVDVEGIFGASLNFLPGKGLQYAIAFDDAAPQTVTLVPAEYKAQNGNTDWEQTVEFNGRRSHSSHVILRSGYHTLRVWMIDAGVVLEKLVVNPGGVRPSYLGPLESFHAGGADRQHKASRRGR